MDEKKSVLSLINEAASSTEHSIVVLPLMCGTGKSSAISEKIAEAIEKNEGIVIATDRVYRFKDYLSPYNEELKAFLQERKEQVVTLKAGKSSDAVKEHTHYPVLMMTSQRFLRLSEEELAGFLSWDNGKRTTIIFDERPELYFQYDLSIEAINQFENAFLGALNSLHLPPCGAVKH